MSFNEDVKNELAQIEEDEPSLKEAELYGILQSGMKLLIKGRGEIGIRIDTDFASVSRRIYKLIKQIFTYTVELARSVSTRFGQDMHYLIFVNDSAVCKEILHYFAIMDFKTGFLFNHNIDKTLLAQEEEKRCYIRGVFLASGYISNPLKEYRIEFNLPNEKYAYCFQEFLRVHFDIQTGYREKKDIFQLYIKCADDVSTILALCKDNRHVLKIQDRIAIKEMKNRMQRVVNCETANMNKTINVALQQIKAINKIIRSQKFTSLSQPLIEAAQLRLDNPQASLSEMANSLDPPISRSTLNKRLLRLVKIAETLPDGQKK